MLWGTVARGSLLTCTCSRVIVPTRAFRTTSPRFAKRDPFEVLGVKRGASKQAIKKAYLEKARAHHPDQNAGTSTTHFIEIQEAYESLQGIVTVRATTTTTTTTTTHREEKPRTWGKHGYASDDHDTYQRGRRNDPNYQDGPQQVFHDTVQVGHIPLVFVLEWDEAASVLNLKTHSFKSRAHPNEPAFKNEESMFASVIHSKNSCSYRLNIIKLDNGAPCIDLVWEDGHIIAKCYAQKDSRFHNPKTNAGAASTSKSGDISAPPATKKLSMDDGRMVVEDSEGSLMGYMTASNTWLKKGLKIETTDGINVGKASWPRFSNQMIECEDEYKKKVATGILQDKRWVVHLSPLASMSQYEVSPLFWIFSCFWAQK